MVRARIAKSDKPSVGQEVPTEGPLQSSDLSAIKNHMRSHRKNTEVLLEREIDSEENDKDDKQEDDDAESPSASHVS